MPKPSPRAAVKIRRFFGDPLDKGFYVGMGFQGLNSAEPGKLRARKNLMDFTVTDRVHQNRLRPALGFRDDMMFLAFVAERAQAQGAGVRNRADYVLSNRLSGVAT